MVLEEFLLQLLLLHMSVGGSKFSVEELESSSHAVIFCVLIFFAMVGVTKLSALRLMLELNLVILNSVVSLLFSSFTLIERTGDSMYGWVQPSSPLGSGLTCL